MLHVCCSMLQCLQCVCSAFAVCCSVLRCVAVRSITCTYTHKCVMCVAVCCSMLQCVAACCSVLQCITVCCSVLQCVACVSPCTQSLAFTHIQVLQVCCSVFVLCLKRVYSLSCTCLFVERRPPSQWLFQRFAVLCGPISGIQEVSGSTQPQESQEI